MNSQDEDHGGSPPCFAHEIIGGHVLDPVAWRDVARFRTAERERLYALRKSMTRDDSSAQAATITALLKDEISVAEGRVIAGYWPIRGELDLRPCLEDLHGHGARIVLPVVIAKNEPLAFHEWQPGMKMKRGIWNIPVPEVARALLPDIVLAPLVGVDEAAYRLGNGGGYYDRTLGTLAPRPLVIGVGQDFCALATIFPQPWDIVMDRVLLGDGRKMTRLD